MKAITREEKIMSGENLTPITRKEMFLAKAAGQDVTTPTPITREEMFLSKIKGGGDSTNHPKAYTVSSVDELPSNAVDGSMAIVEGTREALANTEWMLDQYFESSGAKSEKVYPMKFSYIDEYGDIYTALGVSVKDRGDYIEFSYVHSPALGIFDDGWATDNAEEYRIIAILEEPPKESAEWVMAHGIKESGDTVYITTKSLYTRENGEWVYKCEVV